MVAIIACGLALLLVLLSLLCLALLAQRISLLGNISLPFMDRLADFSLDLTHPEQVNLPLRNLSEPFCLALITVLLGKTTLLSLFLLRVKLRPFCMDDFVRENAAQKAMCVPRILAILKCVAVFHLVDDLHNAALLLRL